MTFAIDTKMVTIDPTPQAEGGTIYRFSVDGTVYADTRQMVEIRDKINDMLKLDAEYRAMVDPDDGRG